MSYICTGYINHIVFKRPLAQNNVILAAIIKLRFDTMWTLCFNLIQVTFSLFHCFKLIFVRNLLQNKNDGFNLFEFLKPDDEAENTFHSNDDQDVLKSWPSCLRQHTLVFLFYI